MKKKITAKILSLLLLGTMLISCDQAVDSDNNSNETKIEVVEENGIATWSDFKEKAGIDFSKSVDNINEITGFKGYANYSELKKFFASTIYFPENFEKRYTSNDLEIFFDVYPSKDEVSFDDITPSVLNDIYKRLTVVNITSTNKSNGSFEYIKISSGKNNEVFDINKFYERISKSEFTIKGITTQTPTNKMLLGIDDEYLSDKLTTDYEKLTYLLNNNLFANATIDKVQLSGNISGIEALYSRENEDKNISFTSEAYSLAPNDKVDNLSLEELRQRQLRGFKMNISNANIYANDFIQDATKPLSFNFAKLNNVHFQKDTDLTDINFDNITSTGNLTFDGALPLSMKFLTADNVKLNNATIVKYTPADITLGTEATGGTNISGLNVKNFITTGTILNEDSFIIDDTSLKGNIEKFKGSKTLYDNLIKILLIKDADTKVDIVKLIITTNSKQYV